MKFAIVFPGQGSQKIGMGKDLYEETIIGKEYFEKVNLILNRDLKEIILNGPQEELNQTKNTQVSIVLISVILTLLLEEEFKKSKIRFIPYATCGHSLGEYTALWYSNVIDFNTLIKLVSLRGNLMQDAPKGGMAAVLNVELNKLEELTRSEKYRNKIVIANYNSPSQYVISGQADLIGEISNEIKLLSGKSIILPVSGAFHSPLMSVPSEIFNKELEKIENLNNSKYFIFQNSDAKESLEKKIILEKLKIQMTSPVYWTQTINNLVNHEVNAFIEIGPGKVLTGLIKKINQDINCFNIYDLNSLKDFIKHYEQLQTAAKTS